MVYETVRTVLFYLDTKVRSGGTIGEPEFTFPNNLINVEPQRGERLRLTMQEVSMEYTFFQTESFNNKVVVLETIDGGPEVARTVQIPIGNYNINTFIAELAKALNDGSQYVYSMSLIQCSYNQGYINPGQILEL